jgi:hypothetical protein
VQFYGYLIPFSMILLTFCNSSAPEQRSEKTILSDWNTRERERASKAPVMRSSDIWQGKEWCSIDDNVYIIVIGCNILMSLLLVTTIITVLLQGNIKPRVD